MTEGGGDIESRARVTFRAWSDEALTVRCFCLEIGVGIVLAQA